MRVCVFFYNRPETVNPCLDALSAAARNLSLEITVHVDGPKDDNRDRGQVALVRSLVNCYDYKSFEAVQIKAKSRNVGLAASILSGVNEAFEVASKVVVVEDDLLVTRDFLRFMFLALRTYEADLCVGSISGFSFPVHNRSDFDTYMHTRPTSWGWATWRNRWQKAEWQVDDNYLESINYKPEAFKVLGADMHRMLQAYVEGRIDSWAIRWALAHHVNGWLAVTPYLSKVENLGFGGARATNTRGSNPFFVLKGTDDADVEIKFNRILAPDEAGIFFSNFFNSNGMRALQKVVPEKLWSFVYWGSFRLAKAYLILVSCVRG